MNVVSISNEILFSINSILLLLDCELKQVIPLYWDFPNLFGEQDTLAIETLRIDYINHVHRCIAEAKTKVN
jgi:hypothetical protein